MRIGYGLLLASAAVAAMAAPAVGTGGLRAQERERDRQVERDELPRDVARMVVRRYNEPAALRASGSLDISEDREIDGNVAVLNGPVRISGHVRGSVVVVNGDVMLRRSARIDGDLIVVGGIVEGRDAARIEGTIETYGQALRYYEEDGRLVASREAGEPWEPERHRVGRWYRRYESSSSRLLLSTANPYNRVEGLPVSVGPQIRIATGDIRLRAEALGIIRSADHFEWKAENLGHDAKAEIQFGARSGIAFGAKSFDIVDGVEEWQLKNSEVGLASFFFHRDYRDYWNRHGGGGYVRLFAGSAFSLTGGYTEERWRSRDARDPWTLFRGDAQWRVNPAMDEGLVKLATAALRIDTRNDDEDPWSGWLITADVERGESDAMRLAELPAEIRTPGVPAADGTHSLQYTRGFLDLRRYNRVSPEGQLNLRLVVGGWLDGDALPLQRRFSLGGAGALPGYDFRDAPSRGVDNLLCSAAAPGGILVPQDDAPDGQRATTPAMCERMALAQIEYRGDMRLSIGGDWDDDDDDRHSRRHFGVHRVGQWVVFADAGRGWLVNSAPAEGLQYGRNDVPALRTFRTDVGLGLDFDAIGFYVAKSTSDSKEPANFFVRVRHRF